MSWLGNILIIGEQKDSDESIEFLRKHRDIGGIRLMADYTISPLSGLTVKKQKIPMPDLLESVGDGAITIKSSKAINVSKLDAFLNEKQYDADISLCIDYKTRYWIIVKTNGVDIRDSLDIRRRRKLYSYCLNDNYYELVYDTMLRIKNDRINIANEIMEFFDASGVKVIHSFYFGITNNMIRCGALSARKGERGVRINPNGAETFRGLGNSMWNYSAPLTGNYRINETIEIVDEMFEIYGWRK